MATLQDLQELFAERKPENVAMQISGFTGFRTSRIEELSQDEIDALYQIHAPREADVEAEFQAFKNELIVKAWRSKILATAEKAGIKKADSFQEFNNWMLSRSTFKRALYSLNVEELKTIHRQLNGVITNNRKSATKPLTKTWWMCADKLKNLN